MWEIGGQMSWDWYLYASWITGYIIHLLHAGEGNMKIYSPKSIIFSEGNMILVGE